MMTVSNVHPGVLQTRSFCSGEFDAGPVPYQVLTQLLNQNTDIKKRTDSQILTAFKFLFVEEMLKDPNDPDFKFSFENAIRHARQHADANYVWLFEDTPELVRLFKPWGGRTCAIEVQSSGIFSKVVLSN